MTENNNVLTSMITVNGRETYFQAANWTGILSILHGKHFNYILILRPFSIHPTQLIVKVYNINTPIDNHAGAYIVFMLTFTSPVSKLAAKNIARPFLFIASSKGGTKIDGDVWEEVGDGIMWVRRR